MRRRRGRKGKGEEEERRCEEEEKECRQESVLTSPRQAVLHSPQWQPTPSLCKKKRVSIDTNRIC